MATAETVRTTSETAPATNYRWVLPPLLFCLVLINYADRAVLGVVAPLLTKAFDLSVAQYGTIASSFGWGYCIFVFLGGAIVSRLGSRRTFAWTVGLWSAFIMAMATASSFVSFVLLRVLFGAAEGPAFPAGAQLFGKWFPAHERARALGYMHAGLPAGSLLAIPFTVWLAHAYGWRVPFIVLGLIGFVWLIAGVRLISDTPQESTRVSRSELARIEAGIREDRGTEKAVETIPWGRIARSPTLWFAGFGFFAAAYNLYFLLTFFPTYLVRERHIEFTSVALLGTLPFVGMLIGTLLGGIISDFVYRKSGRNARAARSYFGGGSLVLTGILICSSMLLQNTFAIVAVISLASCVNFFTFPVFNAIPLDAAPEFGGAGVSITTGTASLSGIVAPLLTGYLVQSTGTFFAAFYVVGGLAVACGILIAVACRPEQL